MNYKSILYILLITISCTIQAQEMVDSVGAIIRDAETGEPIQYVNVYVSPTCGTISNYDGEFCLRCLPSETISMSCIGYKKISCRASELPAVIRMQPISTTLKEITVTRGDDIIYQLVTKMQREAKKHRKTEAQYFFRMATQYPGTDELAEAFMTAKSCVQIRDITFHSGSRGQLRGDQLDGPSLTGLGRTNLHIFLRLSPVLVNYDIWDFIFVPADIVLRRMRNLYNISCTVFTQEDSTEISKIIVSGNPTVGDRPILEGTLYVDRRHLRLLRFDGQMRGLQVALYDQARERHYYTGINYTMHIDYRHDHGFTEIANMSGIITKDSIKIRQLLYNLGEKRLRFSQSERVGENMMRAIDKVGFDSTLWVTNNIVKRTLDEERVAFKDPTFWLANKSNYTTAPTAQQRHTDTYLQDAIRQLKDNTMQLQRMPSIPRSY